MWAGSTSRLQRNNSTRLFWISDGAISPKKTAIKCDEVEMFGFVFRGKSEMILEEILGLEGEPREPLKVLRLTLCLVRSCEVARDRKINVPQRSSPKLVVVGALKFGH